MNDDANSWDQWRRVVLTSQDRMEKSIQRLEDKLDAFVLATTEELTKVKTKAHVWGVIGGIGATLLIELGFYVLTHH